MIQRIASVRPLKNYLLEVKFDDGKKVLYDVKEDMVAATLGMQVFLLTDCLIYTENADISQYPHGGFPELIEFLQKHCCQ